MFYLGRHSVDLCDAEEGSGGELISHEGVDHSLADKAGDDGFGGVGVGDAVTGEGECAEAASESSGVAVEGVGADAEAFEFEQVVAGGEGGRTAGDEGAVEPVELLGGERLDDGGQGIAMVIEAVHGWLRLSKKRGTRK